MRVLVCNDDGIDAPGLVLLEAAARALTDDVWVVAPDGKRSGNSGSVTLHRPYTLTKAADKHYSCSGTPADCIIGAMVGLFDAGPRPDLVLAGINDGRNVGEDIAYSGTLGIAREATFWGMPAVAFSGVKGAEFDAAGRQWLAALVCRLWESRAEWRLEGHFLSINLPGKIPARLRQAFAGRDKIAHGAKSIERRGDMITLSVDSSRVHATVPGDENDLIGAGFATLQRFNAFGLTPLGGPTVALLSGEAAD